MRVGGAGGFSLRADAGWFVLAALVTVLLALRYFPMSLPDSSSRAHWALGAAGALVLFLSIVLHELAHVLVAGRYGISSRSISLDLLGGRAEVASGLPSAGPEITMAVAGPAANAAIALLAGLLLATPASQPEAEALIRFTALINALLAAVNLLPVLPLDGGRMLRALLWAITGSVARATWLAARIGSGFAICMIIFGVLAALAGSSLLGLLSAAIGLYLLRRAAPFLRLPGVPSQP